MHRPKRYSKPSGIAKTFIENGIDRKCFYVMEIDDVIGKSLNEIIIVIINTATLY